MKSVYLKIFKRFFLFNTFILAVTGCGSSSSTANNETGSIAAKLIWSSTESKTATKTLYASPAGVTSIKISVYADASMTSLITSSESIPISSGTSGSLTLGEIPAGNGRAVKVEGSGFHSGLGLDGVLIYLGTATVDVVSGQTATVPITMEAPATNASPLTAPPATSFPVTLTTSVPATIYYGTSDPATIYYTTNGTNPTTSSPNAPSPVNLTVTPPLTLKFFAVVRGLYEAIKEKTY